MLRMRKAKRKAESFLVAGIWLVAIFLLVLLSLHSGTGSPSEAFAQPTPELTPEAYLPFVVRSWPSLPPQPNWLAYVNHYRAMADLPPVTENVTWSDGCWKHARYMVKNDFIGHTEDPNNPWYTPEGQAAGGSSNVWASYAVDTADEDSVDVFMQAPFHAVGIVDPALLQVGFGSYRESDGGLQYGVALDVIRGLGSIPPSVAFPVKWPAHGTTVPILLHWGEYPDPLTSCPGYSTPSGLPIILQIGPGNVTPNVTSHSFMQGSTPLEHCVFDETSYTNPDGSAQSLGRSCLDARDATVLIPRYPLTPGATYSASITVNDQTYTWSFTVSSTALALERTPEIPPH